MARRMFDIVAEKPDPKTPGKTIEFVVGVAFASDRSSKLRLSLDAIPLNFDGKLVVYLGEPISVVDDLSAVK